ncbi:hypothetical protein SpCBS45565_g08068 [Spizellomyces sp. 'palustris']|nr:hypothetical protein SpCBS45565_g08068 [Spizellomyces sp. 'palustris']
MSPSPSTFFPDLTWDSAPYAPPWLASFHVVRFAYFLLGANLAPYILFRAFACGRLGWEHHEKFPATHYRDLVLVIGYAFPLFVLGNYSDTLNWITLTLPNVSIFLYAWIAEHPSLRHSFATVRNWPKFMWGTVLGAVTSILAFAAYHIYLSYDLRVPHDMFEAQGGLTGSTVTGSILGWYILAVIAIPLGLLLAAALTAWYQNGGCGMVGSIVQKMKGVCRQVVGKQTGKPHAHPPVEGPDTSITDIVQGMTAEQPNGIQSRPAWPRTVFHPHHWAIFYFLGFFTRFKNPVSQASAGVLMGIYIHGVAAYGYHDLLET